MIEPNTMQNLLNAMESRIREDVRAVSDKQDALSEQFARVRERQAEHGVRIGNLEAAQGKASSALGRAVTFRHVTIALGTVAGMAAVVEFLVRVVR
jgi:phage-related tail protein